MLTKNQDHYLSCIIQALDLAEHLALADHRGHHTYHDKGDRDFALNVDHRIERQVKQLLSQLTPSIPILGEEQAWSCHQGAKFNLSSPPGIFWVIDPIDGTVNYSRRSPLFGVALALIAEGKPIAAGISFPALGDRYLAMNQAGSFYNGQRLRLQSNLAIEQAIMALGDFSLKPHNHHKNELTQHLLHHYSDRCLRIRMLGSAALQLAWLASGPVDISVTLSNKPWDVQAGVLIAQEAGAIICDRDGSPHSLESQYTLASHPEVMPDLLTFLGKFGYPQG